MMKKHIFLSALCVSGVLCGANNAPNVRVEVPGVLRDPLDRHRFNEGDRRDSIINTEKIDDFTKEKAVYALEDNIPSNIKDVTALTVLDILQNWTPFNEEEHKIVDRLFSSGGLYFLKFKYGYERCMFPIVVMPYVVEDEAEEDGRRLYPYIRYSSSRGEVVVSVDDVEKGIFYEFTTYSMRKFLNSVVQSKKDRAISRMIEKIKEAEEFIVQRDDGLDSLPLSYDGSSYEFRFVKTSKGYALGLFDQSFPELKVFVRGGEGDDGHKRFREDDSRVIQFEDIQKVVEEKDLVYDSVTRTIVPRDMLDDDVNLTLRSNVEETSGSGVTSTQ